MNVKRNALILFKDGETALYPNVKDIIHSGRVVITPHVIAISSLKLLIKILLMNCSNTGYQDKNNQYFEYTALVASLKGSFNIWLNKF
jgi:hypothetical protein